ncbi:MAG: hypothetical protein AAGI46_12750 [Planctomycetota bacterium]
MPPADPQRAKSRKGDAAPRQVTSANGSAMRGKPADPRERTASRRRPPAKETQNAAEVPPQPKRPAPRSPVEAFEAATTTNQQTVLSPQELRGRLRGHVCPFCGHRNASGKGPCEACGMEDDDTTRSATTRRIGPWFLRQTGNPFAPGMKFNVLRELTKQGRVQPDSVVRGPVTHQMWTYAARVRGVAHLFGVCWNCNRPLPPLKAGETPDDFCLYCGALIEPPSNPDQQLEVADTGESLGLGARSKTGQVTDRSDMPTQPTPAVRGVGARKAHIGENKSPIGPPRPRAAKVAVTDAEDGGDALLTTGELATAFNLDRRPNMLGLLGRLPWNWIIPILLILAVGAAIAFYVLGDGALDALPAGR